MPPSTDPTSIPSPGQIVFLRTRRWLVENTAPDPDFGTTVASPRPTTPFHDPDETSPDIQQLRALHAAMDRAVLDAYGWADIPTTCQFLLDYEDDDDEADTGDRKRQKKKPWRYRWPDDIRDEVLARLLALNAERHAEEVRLGIAPGMKPPTPAKKKRPRNPAPPPQKTPTPSH